MYIKQVWIDWNKISEESYLRGIEALRSIESEYEETDAYKIKSMFLRDRENVLKKLLE